MAIISLFSFELKIMDAINLQILKSAIATVEIDRIGELAPGAFHILQIEKVVLESLHNQIRVFAHTANDEELYASRNQDIQVLNSSLEVTSQPREVRIYPGEPAEVTWILKNTGEETLKNLTLDGNGKKCMLRELSPGESIRMAAMYNRRNDTSWINVTARGISSGGYSAFANASVLIKSVRPGIGLKVMPSELDVCPGETAEISCLVSNSGDDHLTDVLLTQDGSALATIGQMEPGEFKVSELSDSNHHKFHIKFCRNRKGFTRSNQFRERIHKSKNRSLCYQRYPQVLRHLLLHRGSNAKTNLYCIQYRKRSALQHLCH